MGLQKSLVSQPLHPLITPSFCLWDGQWLLCPHEVAMVPRKVQQNLGYLFPMSSLRKLLQNRLHDTPPSLGSWPFHCNGPRTVEIYGLFRILTTLWGDNSHFYRFFFGVSRLAPNNNESIQEQSLKSYIDIDGSPSVDVCMPKLWPGLFFFGESSPRQSCMWREPN